MTVITVLARPGSSREEIVWDPWRRAWSVSCKAPAREGRANEALLGFLAQRLEVPRGRLRWTCGALSRVKTLEIDGMSTEEVQRRLLAKAGAAQERSRPPRPAQGPQR